MSVPRMRTVPEAFRELKAADPNSAFTLRALRAAVNRGEIPVVIHFIQLSRDIFDDKYKDLSTGAKWLYVVLNELEHRYTTGKVSEKDWFYRSDKDLANDAGMSLATLKKHKVELKETDLVWIGYMHYKYPETGKKSERKITAYRILK